MSSLIRRAAWLTAIVLLTACPDRDQVVEEIGGAPGRTMEKMRDAVERAQDQAAERERSQLEDE